jgi:hypothetical protein
MLTITNKPYLLSVIVLNVIMLSGMALIYTKAKHTNPYFHQGSPGLKKRSTKSHSKIASVN